MRNTGVLPNLAAGLKRVGQDEITGWRRWRRPPLARKWALEFRKNRRQCPNEGFAQI